MVYIKNTIVDYAELDILIEKIIEKHNSVYEKWKNSDNFRNVNLKKYLVSDIMDNSHPDYLEYIFKYRSFLNDNIIFITTDFLDNNYEYRVKTQNSTESKLSTYMGNDNTLKRENLGGKVPINKCLNDLFGIRYVFRNRSYEFIKIIEHINEVFPKLKVIDSSKNGYKAVHVYFKVDNFSFPWELQIWNEEDYSQNKSSHGIYKQEYTTWEYELKKEG